ncbi:MAG: amidohydrolase family protein [Armatimonadetes bacterium]|nr:amidohydrolase family protein [Armatimonadota bacterium]
MERLRQICMTLPIIDFHCHVKGGDLYRREFLGEQIVRAADEAGIKKTVIFSICLPGRESNELTKREADKFPDRLIPFAHVLPQEGALAIREVRRCFQELGWRGLKLHCGEMTERAPEHLVPLLELCVEFDRPCLIDVASDVGLTKAIVEAVPNCKLVVAHLGAPNQEQLVDQFIALALEHENLYFDLSYCHVPWKMQVAVDALGAERLVFGSDGLLYHPLIELAKIACLKLTDTQLAAILSDNAARLLGLAPGGRRASVRHRPLLADSR